MPRTRTFSCVLALTLAGCTKIPDSYAPPVQRQTPDEFAAGLTHYISMNMPQAPDHIVTGVVPELQSNLYRWTLKNPTFRFRIPRTTGLRLQVDLTIPDETYRAKGPITIQFFVEDHLLDQRQYDKAGGAPFEKPVPAEWLTTDRPVVVRMEIDKIWKSPVDGAERGFIITKLGFIE